METLVLHVVVVVVVVAVAAVLGVAVVLEPIAAVVFQQDEMVSCDSAAMQDVGAVVVAFAWTVVDGGLVAAGCPE